MLRRFLPWLALALAPGRSLAQVKPMLTAQELIKAATCADLPCYRAFALAEGYVYEASELENTDSVHVFVDGHAPRDSAANELDVILPVHATDSTGLRSITFTFYDDATRQRLVQELAALGRNKTEREEFLTTVITWYRGVDDGLDICITHVPADPAEDMPGYYQFQVQVPNGP